MKAGERRLRVCPFPVFCFAAPVSALALHRAPGACWAGTPTRRDITAGNATSTGTPPGQGHHWYGDTSWGTGTGAWGLLPAWLVGSEGSSAGPQGTWGVPRGGAALGLSGDPVPVLQAGMSRGRAGPRGPGGMGAERSPHARAGQTDTCCSSVLTKMFKAWAVEGLGGSCGMGAPGTPGCPSSPRGLLPAWQSHCPS